MSSDDKQRYKSSSSPSHESSSSLQSRLKALELELDRERYNGEREAKEARLAKESVERLSSELKKANDRMKATEQK